MAVAPLTDASVTLSNAGSGSQVGTLQTDANGFTHFPLWMGPTI